MTIRAYSEMYLDDAMMNLAEAFDYVSNSMNFTLDSFMEMFIVSGYAAKFGKGNPKTVSGISGTELAIAVITKSGINTEFKEASTDLNLSAQYWCGYVLAYYQWYTGLSFKYIMQYISMADVLSMYPLMHEVSEDRFVDAVNNIIKREKKQTELQRLRNMSGMSQRQLAEKANVNLRTLQEYESGQKSINKASVKTVLSLADALSCDIEDLLEPELETDE